jgi:uncharacterized glyoxalase superfamily metalloenzyme YdcJ
MSTFIPRADAAFDLWQKNFANKVDPVAGLFGIPEAAITTMHTKKARWDAAYKATESPATCTTVAVLEKNEARKDYEANLRGLNKAYLMNNPVMDDVTRVQMGLPIHKTTRTRVPPPTDAVDLLLRQLSGNRVEVNFSTVRLDAADKEHRDAKPFGVRGVELRWAILPAPPTSHADLVHSEFDTRSPYIFQFDLPDAGKTLYVCARWENTRGQKGPWSRIVNAIVP